jgi:glucosamine--fructose-6-phosphate aminotransferase (isomerizing)
MCGIVGVLYTSNNQNKNSNLFSYIYKILYLLQTRGYHSVGLCSLSNVDNKKFVISKYSVDEKDNPTQDYIFDLLKNDYDKHRGICAIGHTRWATIGEKNNVNAHPHISNNLEIVTVHNGHIDNYKELKNFLEKKNFKFYGKTDSEIIPNYLQYLESENPNSSFLEIIQKLQNKLIGKWAIIILNNKFPNTIFYCKYKMPLVISKKHNFNKYIIVSDPNVFIENIPEYYFLNEYSYGFISQTNLYIQDNNYHIYPLYNDLIDNSFHSFDEKSFVFDFTQQNLDNIYETISNTKYEYTQRNQLIIKESRFSFNLFSPNESKNQDTLTNNNNLSNKYKENVFSSSTPIIIPIKIPNQGQISFSCNNSPQNSLSQNSSPISIQRIYHSLGASTTNNSEINKPMNIDFTKSVYIHFACLDNHKKLIQNANHLVLVGTHSSFHSCMLIKLIYQQLEIFETIQVINALEFNIYDIQHLNDCLYFVVSQSSENKYIEYFINSISSLDNNIPIFGIFNNKLGSFIKDKLKACVLLNAGKDFAYSFIKSFISQYFCMYLLGIYIQQEKNRSAKYNLCKYIYTDFENNINFVIKNQHKFKDIAKQIYNSDCIYILGKGEMYPIALEVSYKFKEIAYIKSFGLSYFELKNGYYNIITNNSIILSFCDKNKNLNDFKNMIQEIKLETNCLLIVFTNENENLINYENKNTTICVFPEQYFPGIIYLLASLYLCYYSAILKNINPDRPRIYLN